MSKKPWLDAYPAGMPTTIETPNQTIPQAFSEVAEKFPERVAVHFYNFSLTYKELQQRIQQIAASLQALGVRPGDRVGILLPNCPQYVVSYYAILAAGATVVQISPFYTEEEMEKIITDAEVHTVICLDLISGKMLHYKQNGFIRNVILVNLSHRLPFLKSMGYRFKLWCTLDLLEEDYLDHILDFDHLLEESKDLPVATTPQRARSAAVLQYTGGTTGLPKGAVLLHDNILQNVKMLTQWAQTPEEGERVLGVLPLFHSYAMTVVMNYALLNGAELILLPRFTPSSTLAEMKRTKPTFFPAIPTIYSALANYMEVRGEKLTGLRACISGAAPLPSEVKKKFESVTGALLVEGYGLSEASPVTHCNPLGEGNRSGSIGVPLPGTTARIVSLETNDDVEMGQEGELLIKGPQIMSSYWRMSPSESSIIDGWLHTGDLARMDEDGFFYIVGRHKNMIISAGLNVYPIEVEEVLREHPSVSDAAVIGVPDSRKGEAVKAYIVLNKGAHLNEEVLEKHSHKHLAGYKCPAIFESVEELPRTLIGKVLYRELHRMEKAKREQDAKVS